jgi:N,N'-diacetylchitobiose transport system substrate-binding protein
MHRFRRLSVLVVVLALAGAGCGAGGSKDGSPPAGAASGAINVWIMEPGSPDLKAFITQATTDFERTHAGAKVAVQFVPWASAHDQFVTAVGGGQVPDVAEMGSTWTPEFGDIGALAPVPATVDGYVQSLVEGATVDGKVYGVPWYAGIRALIYRTDVLAELGLSVPRTWSELVTVGRAVRDKKKMAAFGVAGNANHYVLPMVWQNGGEIATEKDGRWVSAMDGPKAVEAVQFYADLMARHKVVPPEATTWEYDEIIAGGQRDRYAMTQTFAPYGTLINDPASSRTAGSWAWDTVPGHTAKGQSRTWIDGHFLAVPRYTRNADWAIEFIRMACSRQWHARSMERGNAPPRGSVLRDTDMVAKLGWPPSAAAAIETGFPTPANPAWDTLELALRSGVSETLQGQKTAKQALDTVAADWQRSLRRAGIRRG